MKTKSSYLIHFGLHSPSVLYSGTCISLSFHRFICLHIIMVMVMLHHTSGSNHLIFMGEGAMEFFFLK